MDGHDRPQLQDLLTGVPAKRRLSLPVLAAFLLAAALPAAQGKAAPKGGAVDAKEVYEKAKAAAVKWQADAELFDLGNLSTGPVDAEGRSTAWNVKWSSKSAGKINMMSVNDGVLTTFELPGPGGRVVPVKPGTTLWHVSYSGDDYRELFHVAIEGETGKLKVLSD